MNKRFKQLKINAKLKKNLFKDIIYLCYYCKYAFLTSQLTIEHIIPLCLNGSNNIDNITLVCVPCNFQHGKESWKQKRHLNKINYELQF